MSVGLKDSFGMVKSYKNKFLIVEFYIYYEICMKSWLIINSVMIFRNDWVFFYFYKLIFLLL